VNGTWITNDMIEAYCNHELGEQPWGLARWWTSWLYGIDLGRVFMWKYVFLKFQMHQKLHLFP
jgi:leucyl/phenylalanyl-tRNA--protein transferase